jgi:hypothetical protein
MDCKKRNDVESSESKHIDKDRKKELKTPTDSENEKLIGEEAKRKNDFRKFIKSIEINQEHEIIDENIENLAKHLKHLNKNIQLLKDMFSFYEKVDDKNIIDEKNT